MNGVIDSDLAKRQHLLGVYGQHQREGRVVHVLAKRLVDLTDWMAELTTRSRDFH